MMEFYLLDVKSVIRLENDKVAPFDYVNTFFSKNQALIMGEAISHMDGVLSVAIHKWILNENGEQIHCEGPDSVYVIV